MSFSFFPPPFWRAPTRFSWRPSPCTNPNTLPRCVFSWKTHRLINIIVGRLILLSPGSDFKIRFFKAFNAQALNSLQDSSGRTSVDSGICNSYDELTPSITRMFSGAVFGGADSKNDMTHSLKNLIRQTTAAPVSRPLLCVIMFVYVCVYINTFVSTYTQKQLA